jgi:GT2 family glycosyltransferase
MKSSIIIPTKDRKLILFEAIRSIERQTRKPDELIIVDASSNQDFKEELVTDFGSLNIKYLHTEPGLTKQRNIGIQSSSGDVIFFFDDDVILETDYIRSVLKVFGDDKRGEIGAVMGKITAFSESPRRKFRRLVGKAISRVFLLTELGGVKFKLSGFPRYAHLLNQPQYIECLSGCCMAFRRALFNSVKFDENFTLYAYMEDSDIAKGVLNQGYKIHYEPSARLIHKHSPISRLSVYRSYRMLVVNHYYLFKKNWPQTPLRKIAFWWSVVGVALIGIYSPRAKGMRGAMAGVLDILMAREELVRKGKKGKCR